MIIKNIIFEKINNYSYPVLFTGNSISSLDKKIINKLNSYKSNSYASEELLINLSKKKYLPTLIHFELASLQLPIITEAYDGLHKIAGSKNVIELHGNVNKIICTKCDYSCDINYLRNYKLAYDFNCPKCGFKLRPDIVFPGESIKSFHLALNEIYKSDLVIIIGSNMENWPANKIISKAYLNGSKLLKFDVN